MFFNFILSRKFFFNGYQFRGGSSIYKNVCNMWGFGKNLVNILSYRLERREADLKKLKISDLRDSEWAALIKTIGPTLPPGGSLKKRHKMNIYFLDIIFCYRGWRHANGLPTRGQRTWTNSWSAYKSNTILRSLKIKMGRKYYGNLPTVELQTAILAEQINLAYKIHWKTEWKAAKKERIEIEKKGVKWKIDLYSMANNQVMNPTKYKTMTKKEKQSFKKNHFSMGFDPGFTRPLMRELFNSRSSPSAHSAIRSKLVLSKNDSQFKKKPPKKKKTDYKAKNLLHEAKKKKKNLSGIYNFFLKNAGLPKKAHSIFFYGAPICTRLVLNCVVLNLASQHTCKNEL